MTPLLVPALVSAALAALLEEAAVWYLGRAIEARHNEEENDASAASRMARQARLLSRGFTAVAFGWAGALAIRRGDPILVAAVILAGLLWSVLVGAALGVRSYGPWNLLGRAVFRPLHWLGSFLRALFLAGCRVLGVGAPISSLDRAEELDLELSWLGGRTSPHEADSMVATLHQFGESRVEDVMVRREAIAALDAEALVPDILERVRAEGYSRYPVYSETLDTVVGVLHVLDLLGADPGRTARELARPPLLTLSTKPVGLLLRELQTTYNQMAVVVDEYGGTAGLVTVEDLLEELVGEIEDELDEELPRIRRLGPGRFWVDATVAVDELNETFDIDLEEGEYDSVAGLVLERLERIPRPGEGLREDGVWIEVLAAQPHRIESLLLVLTERSASRPR